MVSKHIPESVLYTFSHLFRGQNPEYFAGGHDWSDGTLFTCHHPEGTRLLKIMQARDQAEAGAVQERMAFARYLAEGGISTTCPISSSQGNIVELIEHNGCIYLAFSWKKLPGEAMDDQSPLDLHDLYWQWGAMLGKMHHLAQGYPTWQASQTVGANGKPVISRIAEWEVFYHWLQDEEVKAAWLEMKAALDAYPINRQNFGFIHNDAHTGNILRDGSQLHLLDFDVANCLWFALDLGICLNSEYARILHHSSHKACAGKLRELFIAPFMQGYASQNTLPGEELRQIGRFVHYRQFLMFAVFYDQIKAHNPHYLESMKAEIIKGGNYTREQVENYFGS